MIATSPPLSALLPFSPQDLGLPRKFSAWRKNQPAIITDVLDSQERFSVVNAPTGSGKTISYVALALLMGVRTAILTATKGLQDQLLEDFRSVGLVDIRGRDNYPCHLGPNMTCEDGGHLHCQYQGDESACMCPHKEALKRALESQLVITNYSCWIATHRYAKGLGDFGLLICDEAHAAPSQVTEAMAVYFSTEEIYRFLRARFPAHNSGIVEWRSWAKALLTRAEAEVERATAYARSAGGSVQAHDIKYLSSCKKLLKKLETLSGSQGDWMAEAATGPSRSSGYRIEPLWAKEHANKILFLGVPKVLLVSATVVPQTLSMLGVEPAAYDYREYPAVFPAWHSPLIYVPTASVTQKTFAIKGYSELWMKRIDQLVEDRLDRKGIIHAVSYKRKDLILEKSAYSDWMLSHDPGDTVGTIAEFKRAEPPAVLVSPSADTGYDFPHGECRFQIMAKVPYPDTRGAIMEARCDSKTGDPTYSLYLTSQRLIQSCGRGDRAEDDWCENLVVDDQIRGFMARASGIGLLPEWFRRKYRRSDALPEPMKGDSR